ncbi:hypothetical protein ACFYW6_39550 [Streptomyces sp. NPDC002659]|uniref:hypothetical protein n=1 Tax=Streptomyces sp. NPDC002659 TaxID=3364656 RepID=UPI0036BA90D1
MLELEGFPPVNDGLVSVGLARLQLAGQLPLLSDEVPEVRGVAVSVSVVSFRCHCGSRLTALVLINVDDF